MSAIIEGNTVSLTKGDTLQIHLNIEDATGAPYTPAENDAIRFAMKERYEDETPVMLKEIDPETLTFTITPEDTKELPCGAYKYDIEITTAGGVVDTIIPRAVFNILDEVL